MRRPFFWALAAITAVGAAIITLAIRNNDEAPSTPTYTNPAPSRTAITSAAQQAPTTTDTNASSPSQPTSAPTSTQQPDKTSSTSQSTTAQATSTPELETTVVPLEVRKTSDGKDYVPIHSRRFSVYCYISADKVDCQLPSELPGKGNGFTMYASGKFYWVTGDMGDDPFQTIPSYGDEIYTALGWTMRFADGVLYFTSEGTGHGVAVSDAGASPF